MKGSTYGATAPAAFTTTPTKQDPYHYQVGFGSRFATEALPGVLPSAANTPQNIKYELFSEGFNGTHFISSRATVKNVWFYRIRPAVASLSPVKLETQNPDLVSNFTLSNPTVDFRPQQLDWHAFPLPPDDTPVDFIDGIKTIGGNGDPTIKEGLAVHMFLANTSMGRRAFANNDGEMLILPQSGRIDVQTEHGHIMVRPGELLVIQAGVRFKVTLPDGPVRGYIQEIYGAHYELPEMGAIGSNGMALPRDFEVPVASFDIDESEWEIIYKNAGTLYSCTQDHTPFDVVAWHGNYAPYKYALEKFIQVANVDREQVDPTCYCVLTAKSKIPGVSLADFLVFLPKWHVSSDTFRPPYYHRNMPAELLGIIKGVYPGSAHDFNAGGLSYTGPYMPHGETYDKWKWATTRELVSERVGEGSISFMMHMSIGLGLTPYALKKCGTMRENVDESWVGVKGHFFDHIDEINEDLKKAGRPPLGTGRPTEAVDGVNGNGVANGH